MGFWKKLFGTQSKKTDTHSIRHIICTHLEEALKARGQSGERVRQAALAGKAEALLILGEILGRGSRDVGVSRNIDDAFLLCRAAAEADMDQSEYEDHPCGVKAFWAMCKCARESEFARRELVEYCRDYVDEKDKDIQDLNMEVPVHIRKACLTCVHYMHPNMFTTGDLFGGGESCHHYDDGRNGSPRTIIVSNEVSSDVYCSAWKSSQLFHLIFIDNIYCGRIDGGLRRPQLEVPPNGQDRLRRHL